MDISQFHSTVKTSNATSRERYLKKISVVGVSAIPSEKFSSECLPPIEVPD